MTYVTSGYKNGMYFWLLKKTVVRKNAKKRKLKKKKKWSARRPKTPRPCQRSTTTSPPWCGGGSPDTTRQRANWAERRSGPFLDAERMWSYMKLDESWNIMKQKKWNYNELKSTFLKNGIPKVTRPPTWTSPIPASSGPRFLLSTWGPRGQSSFC